MQRKILTKQQNKRQQKITQIKPRKSLSRRLAQLFTIAN